MMPKEKQLYSYNEEITPERKLADNRRAFEEFAYTVAHDMNAALRIIVSFAQLLQDKCRKGEYDDKALHYVDIINDNGHKAQEQLASLLQYSRLDTIKLKPEKIDCNELVVQAFKQLKAEMDAGQARVICGPLPQVTADLAQFKLLFQCLLSNALKFGGTRPDIAIDARRGHEAWVFSVTDHGIGIAPKNHEAIFAVFRKLHPDNEYPGSGMGLALAKRIVELHSGLIWVESQLQEGAAFYFTLPDILPAGSTT